MWPFLFLHVCKYLPLSLSLSFTLPLSLDVLLHFTLRLVAVRRSLYSLAALTSVYICICVREKYNYARRRFNRSRDGTNNPSSVADADDAAASSASSTSCSNHCVAPYSIPRGQERKHCASVHSAIVNRYIRINLYGIDI